MSRDELLAEIGVELESADDAVRAAWERIRIEPEKWQCSPWSDAGNGFWAVAVIGTRVVWFNDLSGGFNTSLFTTRGVIDEYGRNQADFGDFLRTLPEARSAEAFAANVPAHELPPFLVGAGRIERRRTTYWDIYSEFGGAARVHFSDKQESRFITQDYDSIELVDEHPVLSDYHEPWGDLFVSGAEQRASALMDALSKRVDLATRGFRRLSPYISGSGTTQLVLDSGGGLLLRAPLSIATLGANVVRELGASATVIEDQPARPGYRALLLGSSFVVAKAFRFVTQQQRLPARSN